MTKPSLRNAFIFLAILLASVLVISACASPTGSQEAADQPAQAPQPQADQADPVAAQPSDDQAAPVDDPRSKGSADAPILIVEYSDFQCPYCSRWVADTFPTILDEYIESGKARLVFRDFPLGFHANADNAAVASRCAAEQDAFWPMHDRLFASQSEWSDLADPGETFTSYAEEIGLDTAIFATCLNSDQFDAEIREDLAAGQAAGVSGTPSFVINGQLLVGAQPASAFRTALDRALAGEQISEPAPEAQGPAPEPLDIPIEGAPAKGDPDAPLTIVEYSDYQCPYCARFAVQTLPDLLQQYVDTGKVLLVFKDFPLTQIHAEAQKAAEAARCVRELGDGDEAYWAMHDKLFAGQGEWGGQPNANDIFAGYAEELGVDTGEFSACLDSGKYASAVEADFEEGARLGVRGTPTFFINGQPFVGAQPIANFQQAIADVEAGRSIVPPTPVPTPTPAPLAEPIPLEDAAGIKGSADAPVVIVEYSDYQCPFCQRHFLQTMPQIQEYIDEGEVMYVFKDFPLTSIHPEAVLAAEAARCAGEQDAYWPMHDQIFAGQGDWGGNPAAGDVFASYAADLDLDQGAFQACLESGKYQEAIEANLQEGVGYGVRGTPGFFVNGQPVFGAYPFEVFQQLIEAGVGE